MSTYSILDYDSSIFERTNKFFSRLQDLKNYSFAEGKDSYSLEVIIPGFSKKEIDITILNDVLRIKAASKDSRGRSIYFDKSFQAPKASNASEIKAVLENGVLNLNIPKVKEAVPASVKIE
jgi:HSP20 family protein